ncbi:MAG: hypothetical protein K9J37_05910 [Saprospiraceae bacterium]|nr:hypothetical protein [Saprospiraceae bacterium]MCF8249426.1 hypothetical protein [Saprospiraceae bacterium]MCF8279080.1 hypothetical protein [Bacteroidales bacterium]MCF8311555.1 hypothetical protein [Saprospiraceae bacterium]MCF8440045.1 hypothetical protein [Saprospiraceae bacterium]
MSSIGQAFLFQEKTEKMSFQSIAVFKKSYLCPPFGKLAFKMSKKTCGRTALGEMSAREILRTTIQ